MDFMLNMMTVKLFMPKMAAELGFEFEFVTYAWPHWLHRQTEKQRVMWSYKILFLDVLFRTCTSTPNRNSSSSFIIQNFIILNAKFIILNAQFIILNTLIG